MKEAQSLSCEIPAKRDQIPAIWRQQNYSFSMMDQSPIWKAKVSEHLDYLHWLKAHETFVYFGSFFLHLSEEIHFQNYG
jgi:hypothetical protein